MKDSFQNPPVVLYPFLKVLRLLKIWVIKLNIQFKLKGVTYYILVHYNIDNIMYWLKKAHLKNIIFLIFIFKEGRGSGRERQRLWI